METNEELKFVIARFFKEYRLHHLLNEDIIYKNSNPLKIISILFTWSMSKEGYNFWLEAQINMLYTALRIFPNKKSFKLDLNVFLDDSHYHINAESKEIKLKYRNLYKKSIML